MDDLEDKYEYKYETYGEWQEEADLDYAQRANDVNREFGL